jgi:hypothetical protein
MKDDDKGEGSSQSSDVDALGAGARRHGGHGSPGVFDLVGVG